MHRVSICLIILFCACMSCKKSNQTVRKSDVPDSTSIDVPYGGGLAQKMDVYLPNGRTTSSTPFILMIHGGGWTGGDKAEFNTIISRLQTILPDYAFFNINYRLFDGSNNQYPAQEEDVKLAVNFICSKSNELNISNKMVIMGASAGAQLALLQAYKYDQPNKAVTAISFYGPTDMVEFYNHPPSPALQPSLYALFGSSPEQNLWSYQQASPAFFINNKTPPTLILHGNMDQLVPVSQSTLLKNKLQSAGVPNELVLYPNEGHGWVGTSLEDSYNHIQTFLRAHVK
jgi:acetyl esterase/lipase